MASLAKVTIIGYIGSAKAKEITVKSTGEVKKVINFSVAINYKKQDTEFVDWYSCELYANSFDVAWFQRGKQIYVEGILRIETFVNQENVEMTKPKIYVDKLLFMGKKED
ncbi:single-stranded DNA-binding protein [Hugenholtzia roseola]|uniref:single-stranded DNA-binding protein n=1 Tax=Hugenholtzia roseola TaxID=1002 RepID=UPI0004219191|nr:single-stranded DNA-binding protein [Hugenholtzia roseola]